MLGPSIFPMTGKSFSTLWKTRCPGCLWGPVRRTDRNKIRKFLFIPAGPASRPYLRAGPFRAQALGHAHGRGGGGIEVVGVDDGVGHCAGARPRHTICAGGPVIEIYAVTFILVAAGEVAECVARDGPVHVLHIATYDEDAPAAQCAVDVGEFVAREDDVADVRNAGINVYSVCVVGVAYAGDGVAGDHGVAPAQRPAVESQKYAVPHGAGNAVAGDAHAAVDRAAIDVGVDAILTDSADVIAEDVHATVDCAAFLHFGIDAVSRGIPDIVSGDVEAAGDGGAALHRHQDSGCHVAHDVGEDVHALGCATEVEADSADALPLEPGERVAGDVYIAHGGEGDFCGNPIAHKRVAHNADVAPRVGGGAGADGYAMI